MLKKPKHKVIGALWLNETRAGVPFFSGTITLPNGEVLDVSVFPNKFKAEGDSKPHYIVYTPDYGMTVPEEELATYTAPDW